MQSTKKKDSIVFIEISIFVVVWLIVFLSPVIIQYSDDEIEWEQILINWRRLFPFLIISLINHFVIVPLFFFRKTIIKYIISTLVLLLLFSFTQSFIHKQNRQAHRPEAQQEFRPPHPPPNAHPPARRPEDRFFEEAKTPPRQPMPGGMPPFLNTFIIALLILGFDTGLRTAFKWSKTEKEKEVLVSEKVKSELAFLRNQVNPHFLMNTLNNIHALVDIDSEKAKDTVIRLSKLMRYLLYDTDRDFIPIKEELSFIRSYVELMQMRISKRTDVKLEIIAYDEEKKIPPLLFTSLIENAFKYGVSSRNDTFINIEIITTENSLNFNLSNTIAQNSEANNLHSGIGLDNTRKRLEILYGEEYSMDLSSKNNIFSVSLKLPL